MTAVRAVSYGGGVQSTALLVLAAEGRIDFDAFLFANVGDDSEHPATLRYVREVAAPFAADHDIELVELRRVTRAGEHETLLGRALADGNHFPLPFRGENGAPMRRTCTGDFKVKVIRRELRHRGATGANPATVALGISVDEIERAGPAYDRHNPSQRRVYPLLDLGLHRSDCHRIIAAAGLPQPRKSSCWFCPFHDREAWRGIKRDTPGLFDQAVELERRYQAKLAALGKRNQWITAAGARSGLPLDRVIDDQAALPGLDAGCDSGWCFT